ncbi:FAD-dependent oxidoreductase [Bdellovibrio sp. SKB1291214]|uniref:FAD-dependent oxidoreductase n=1 Tax=Bdellovibrio sp. SKB1291214 TaxID=1732569 RepID=UPI0015958B88|nr:FAD-dependent oxidoreductase [Bdellovibrio sp. SKB1291214]UYL09932.1 FAD-dependent oxidoreductase [Bdellovibrio sp. SKB1291214]
MQQKTESFWQKDFSLSSISQLDESLNTDVCVVGGGVAGLLTAYELLKQGLRVVVLERGPLNKNESSFTTAHLSAALDDGFDHMLHLHGQEKLRLFYQSHRHAIQLIEKIITDEKIDCEFARVNGYLFLSPDKDQAYLAREYEAALLAGAEDIKFASEFPETFFPTGPAIRFEGQGQLHPLKFVQGLVQAILRHGGKVYEYSNAEYFHEGEETFVIAKGDHRIDCKDIVLATNSPTTSNKIYLKQAAYRTYAIALKIPKGSMTPALYWDTQENYHYVRSVSSPERNFDVLIVGGEDHRVGEGHPEKCFENLLEWVQQRLEINSTEMVASWSGQVEEPVDGIAFIGLSPGKKNTYIVTGDSGHGYTHAAIASKIITGLIKGEHHQWASIYDPNRFTLKAAKDYLSENANTLQQYADWIVPHESIETLNLNEGCIVNRGLQKMAVYKDEEGKLFKMSAVCPHMGGLVKWNSVEKTWDCPCHGSRFNRFGETLHPPATTNLQSLDGTKKEVPGEHKDRQEPNL